MQKCEVHKEQEVFGGGGGEREDIMASTFP